MRNVLAIPAVLLVPVSSLRAQASLELAVGRATLRQSFAYDCCGAPVWKTFGSAFDVRIMWPAGRVIEAGVEGGMSVTARPDMRWLMASGAITAAGRVAPWARLGAGWVIQPGECPADAPDTSPDCRLALRPARPCGGRALAVRQDRGWCGSGVGERHERRISPLQHGAVRSYAAAPLISL